MKLAAREFRRVWQWTWIKAHPVRFGGILVAAFLWWPSGLWLGIDRLLAKRYPGSRWFR